jgi:hypothetical protein
MKPARKRPPTPGDAASGPASGADSRILLDQVKAQTETMEDFVREALGKKPRQPATDAQLARLWPLWNALPATRLPEDKFHILNGGLTAEHQTHLKRLRRQFPRSEFPLSTKADATAQDDLTRAEHHQALLAAEAWAKLLDFRDTTRTHHQALVENQWAYRDADYHASGRIAIWRTFRELEITHPQLELSRPTLADIAHVQERFTAYREALANALAALARLLFKIPAFRNLPPDPLPLAERALGVPNPPDNVPRFLYIARLKALGICSPARLAEFMRDDFPKLDQAKRKQFNRVAAQPRHGKDPFPALRVWCLDNAPIFRQFKWQCQDVLTAASEKGIPCPCARSETQARMAFKTWASRHRLSLRLKRGTTPYSDFEIRRSKPLLSPPPVFGDVLKLDFSPL